MNSLDEDISVLDGNAIVMYPAIADGNASASLGLVGYEGRFYLDERPNIPFGRRPDWKFRQDYQS